MSRRFSTILLLLLLAPSLASSQTRDALVKGRQLRVVSRCEMARDSIVRCPTPGTPWPYEWTYSGQLEALDADTIHIRMRSNEEAFAIPTTSIARLSYRDGTRSNTLRGAGIGLLGGALLGGVVGSTMDFCIFDCDPATEVGVLVGAPAGLLIGSVIGALIRSERWRAVSMDGNRIRVAPRLDSPGFMVTMTF